MCEDELGIDYRLDPTHYIEYKKGELEKELKAAGLKIKEVEYGWGEMWCVITFCVLFFMSIMWRKSFP